MRIIVTGVSPDRKTIVVKDDEATNYLPVTYANETQFIHILGSDQPVELPSDGSQITYGPSFFPLAGGFRFWFLTIPGNCSAPPLQPTSDLTAEPCMAYADTVEWVIVLSGTIDHILANGERFTLQPNDSIVQIGASHRWENRLDLPCVMAVAAIGASAKTPSPWMKLPPE
jgi:hypothetical protein